MPAPMTATSRGDAATRAGTRRCCSEDIADSLPPTVSRDRFSEDGGERAGAGVPAARSAGRLLAADAADGVRTELQTFERDGGAAAHADPVGTGRDAIEGGVDLV